MLNFKVLSAITQKTELSEEDQDLNKSYDPFMINRALSFFPDTIFQANLMNRYPDLPPQMQFDYLYHSIKSRKRYSGKWPKKIADDNSDLELVKEFFGYSTSKAREMLALLSIEQLEELRITFETGGIKNDTR